MGSLCFGSGPNTRFCVSNTATNAYDTNISYTNIQIRQTIVRPSEQQMKMFLGRIAPKMLKKQYRMKATNVNYGTLDTHVHTISLKNDFTTTADVEGILVFLDAPGLRTTYNDADSCKTYSGSAIIGYEILKNGKTLVDHKQSAIDLRYRKSYSQMVHKNRFTHDLPLDILNNATDVSKFYVLETFIDLQNLEIWDNHENALAGINSAMNDYEVKIYVADNTPGASVNVHSCLVYRKEIISDKGSFKTL